MCVVIHKIDYCMVQQLPHKVQSVFALKPDANYKAHSEDYAKSSVVTLVCCVSNDHKDFTALNTRVSHTKALNTFYLVIY
jgi:hypothetical protein